MKPKEQRIKIKTKGGLLAAFECAKDFYGVTNITLMRVTGITNYKLSPLPRHENYIKFICRAKKKIKSIPAKKLLY